MPANIGLIHEARRLTTGANVHELNGALAMYQAAACEDNPASQNAARKMELNLAAYVKRLRSLRAQSQTL